jgi:hypothetical protein
LLTSRCVISHAVYQQANIVLTQWNKQLPVGGWPRDPKLAEVGNFVKLTLENDIEGYTLLMWHNVLQWPKEDYQLFLMGMRKMLKNRRVHSYMKVRYVYGRKPTTVEW